MELLLIMMLCVIGVAVYALAGSLLIGLPLFLSVISSPVDDD